MKLTKTTPLKSVVVLLFLLIMGTPPAFSQADNIFSKMDFLIGSWEFDAKSLMPDGTYQPQVFYSDVSYIFGGNASKDDFMFKNENGETIIYGSTIRSYDAQAGKWKMLWYNFNLSFITEMTGDYVDGEFHFNGEGRDERGDYLEKIVFYDISENQYSWKSDKSYDNGQTWLKDFFSYTASRIAAEE
ncbi:MAG: hypothetical protein RIC80_12960 [Cyclobacteriaceae bacterium]